MSAQFNLPLQETLLAVPPGLPRRKISKAFLAAYRAGRQAARNCAEGKPGATRFAPYKNRRDWRRAFRHYWNEGFADFEHQKPERYE